MAAAQAGERPAYNALLRQCIPIIRAVARRTGAPGDCLDDIVQETLMTVHHARYTYDPRRPFIAWVSALARRRSIDVLRRCGGGAEAAASAEEGRELRLRTARRWMRG